MRPIFPRRIRKGYSSKSERPSPSFSSVQKEVGDVTVADLCFVGDSAGVRDCRRLHELGQPLGRFDVCRPILQLNFRV